jgi:large subunit ribosomal protein L6
VSRVGKNPVVITKDIKVTRVDDVLNVKGPKGELSTHIHPDMNVEITPEEIIVTRPSDIRMHKALHGTTRANIQNLVTGVSTGFQKNLELVGVGYRAEMKKSYLQLNLGYSHIIIFAPPAGITLATPSATTITIQGIDKGLVGQVAAKIRSLRPPEPYKGKGVKYDNETIRRKAGKTAKS